MRWMRAAVIATLVALGPVPPAAAAFVDVGTQLDPVDLPALAGGKAALFSPGARANVLVFFRADQERSLDALRQLAGCEKELSQGVRWVAVVSGSTAPADVRAAASSAGIRMPVLLDEGDKVYDKLGVRMFPAVAVLDGKGVVKATEPFRQLDFADAVKAQVRYVLGEIDRTALDRALNPASSKLPGQDDPSKKAMRDVNMARRLIELGQFDAAVTQAQKALEQAPVPAAFPVLALGYAKLGKCAESSRMQEQARKVAPDSADLSAARTLCAGK